MKHLLMRVALGVIAALWIIFMTCILIGILFACGWLYGLPVPDFGNHVSRALAAVTTAGAIFYGLMIAITCKPE